jgi:hypothetical protein
MGNTTIIIRLDKVSRTETMQEANYKVRPGFKRKKQNTPPPNIVSKAIILFLLNDRDMLG